MKRSRFTEEQIIAILREQETGLAVAELCRKHGLSSPIFAKYSGLDMSEARRACDDNHECSRRTADLHPGTAQSRNQTTRHNSRSNSSCKNVLQ